MNQPKKILISSHIIHDRVKQLGKKISLDYRKKNVVMVGVLQGAFIFMADLMRWVSIPHGCDFIKVASYEGKKSSGKVKLHLDVSQSLKGKHVLLIEDIVETGHTLEYLLKTLKSKKPASIKVCTFLYKKEVNPEIEKKLKYVGFEIPNKFVVGYGLDVDGAYRHLQDLWEV